MTEKTADNGDKYTIVAGTTAIYHDRNLTDFDSDSYHILAPNTHVIEEDGPYRVVVTGVRIDADTKDGVEVYKPPGEYGGKLALTKLALVKMMHAAGIEIVPEHTGRQDDGKNADYCDFKVTLRYRTPIGTVEMQSCSKSIHLDNETRRERMAYKKKAHLDKGDGKKLTLYYRKGEDIPLEEWVDLKTEERISEIAVNMPRLAETKAMNACVRLILNLKHKYTPAELAKPFVIPRIEYTPSKDKSAVAATITEMVSEANARHMALMAEKTTSEELREHNGKVSKVETELATLRRVRDAINGKDRDAVAPAIEAVIVDEPEDTDKPETDKPKNGHHCCDNPDSPAESIDGEWKHECGCACHMVAGQAMGKRESGAKAKSSPSVIHQCVKEGCAVKVAVKGSKCAKHQQKPVKDSADKDEDDMKYKSTNMGLHQAAQDAGMKKAELDEMIAEHKEKVRKGKRMAPADYEILIDDVLKKKKKAVAK